MNWYANSYLATQSRLRCVICKSPVPFASQPAALRPWGAMELQMEIATRWKGTVAKPKRQQSLCALTSRATHVFRNMPRRGLQHFSIILVDGIPVDFIFLRGLRKRTVSYFLLASALGPSCWRLAYMWPLWSRLCRYLTISREMRLVCTVSKTHQPIVRP